jgi:hypothetical protein
MALRFRWTVAMASKEFHKSPRDIHTGLREAAIEPGPDGLYSTRDITLACFSLPALEKRAKEARLEQQIAEANIAKLKQAENEGRLADVGR